MSTTHEEVSPELAEAIDKAMLRSPERNAALVQDLAIEIARLKGMPTSEHREAEIARRQMLLDVSEVALGDRGADRFLGQGTSVLPDDGAVATKYNGTRAPEVEETGRDENKVPQFPGMTVVFDEFDDGSYDWERVTVWQADEQPGDFYVMEESGCSCNNSFEGRYTVSDLVGPLPADVVPEALSEFRRETYRESLTTFLAAAQGSQVKTQLPLVSTAVRKPDAEALARTDARLNMALGKALGGPLSQDPQAEQLDANVTKVWQAAGLSDTRRAAIKALGPDRTTAAQRFSMDFEDKLSGVEEKLHLCDDVMARLRPEDSEDHAEAAAEISTWQERFRSLSQAKLMAPFNDERHGSWAVEALDPKVAAHLWSSDVVDFSRTGLDPDQTRGLARKAADVSRDKPEALAYKDMVSRYGKETSGTVTLATTGEHRTGRSGKLDKVAEAMVGRLHALSPRHQPAIAQDGEALLKAHEAHQEQRDKVRQVFHSNDQLPQGNSIGSPSWAGAAADPSLTGLVESSYRLRDSWGSRPESRAANLRGERSTTLGVLPVAALGRPFGRGELLTDRDVVEIGGQQRWSQQVSVDDGAHLAQRKDDKFRVEVREGKVVGATPVVTRLQYESTMRRAGWELPSDKVREKASKAVQAAAQHQPEVEQVETGDHSLGS